MATNSVIGALRVNLGLDSAQFTRGAGQARTSMSRLERTMHSAGRNIARAGRVIALSFTAIGAAAIGGAIAGSRQLQDLSNQARIAGESAQDFKILALASKEFGIEQDKLADILKDVNDKFGDFAATGAGPLKDFFENIAPKVGITEEAFRGLSSSDALQLYVSSLEKANVSQAEMTFYMEAIASDATALIPLFQNNGQAIADMTVRAKELGLSLDDDMIAAASRARSEFGVVADVMKTRLAAAFVDLMPVISDLAETAIPLIIAAMEAVRPVIEAITLVLQGDFKGAWESVRPIVSSAADGMMDVLSGLVARAAQAIKDLASSIVTELLAIPAQIVEAARDVGRNIISGIKEGLMGGGETVGSVARRNARRVVSEVEDELEIRSPSRVFMRIGEYISEGMAIGIDSRAADVEIAAMALADSAVDATENLPFGNFLDGLASSLSQINKLSDAWGTVKNTALDTLRSIGQNLIQGGLRGIFSGIGGFGGPVFPSTPSFTGLYDKGGSIPSGGFGIVGERGPEFVMGPASVVGREDTAKMMGSSGNSAPVYNIDARGAQAGVADQIVSALRDYDARLPGRMRQLQNDPYRK